MTSGGAILFALIVCCSLFDELHGKNWEPCGDWIPFEDEKCFKIIDDTLRTFDEAKDVCVSQEPTSTLPVIRSSEEQQFLSDYLFKTEQKVENFWIGAKYSSENGTYIWIDNSSLNYTNWDSTQSLRLQENHCVHLQADMAVLGKWKDGRCVKKNAVVCQRMQFWTIEFLQKKFLDSRKQQKYLTQSLASANQRIDELKQNLIPVGFLYTQLPKETTPSEIWSWMTWTDVSSEYAGVFFRMEGGQAAPFGSVQDDNSPRLTHVENSISFLNTGGNIPTPTGELSNPVVSGSWNWSDSNVYVDLKFRQSDGEVRPRNMAIRVWRRTG